MDRRNFLANLAAGAGALATQAACATTKADVASAASTPPAPGLAKSLSPSERVAGLTPAALAQAEQIMAVHYTDRERQQLMEVMGGQINRAKQAQELNFSNDALPAQLFDPRLASWQPPAPLASTPVLAPAVETSTPLHFADITQLGRALRRREISCVELTKLALDRLEKHGFALNAVVHLLPQRALEQASQLDKELAAGKDRGPLHGIPYGAKDLFAATSAPTTWGAEPYAEQAFSRDALVIERLTQAGAVLVAKLSLGALAFGDQWMGKTTRNPWAPIEGSSGSSAGSAAVVAAGLVPFALGSETLGSIMSPSQRCGTVGLRPSFGKVPLTGAMSLCWSLDKAGPLTRTATDAILVLRAIEGMDASDPRTIAYAASADIAHHSLPALQVAYSPKDFESASLVQRDALAATRELIAKSGGTIREIDWPEHPYEILYNELFVEAAACFAELTTSGRDDLLAWQESAAWPNQFRAARFISAIDLIQSQRVRRQVMIAYDQLLRSIDAIITPATSDPWLSASNYAGLPAIAVPVGLETRAPRSLFDEPLPGAAPVTVPSALAIGGKLNDESRLALLGQHLQRRLETESLRPPGF